MTDFVRTTPFHARTAALNRANSWTTRNRTTLATQYLDSQDEAIAARSRVIVADISWRWRVAFEGSRAVDFLSRLLTRNPAVLSPGNAFKALWLSEGGGVRGAGALARNGRESFTLVSAASDHDWILRAATQTQVSSGDISRETGGLAIVGPYARAMLQYAGFGAEIEQLAFEETSWRGLSVTISRWGEHGGYELWCKADDCLKLWDGLMQAGASFGIQPAGLKAMDTLDVEAGIARPLRDWQPAQDDLAKTPTPPSLSLESLIDENHETFNGRMQWVWSRKKETRKLVGIEIDSDVPAPHTPLMAEGKVIGHCLSSFYSPALRRAIALAQVDVLLPSTMLTLTLPPTFGHPQWSTASAEIAELPFLLAPDQITP